MSLDLYLTSKHKREYVGTGVYVRKNGETVELKTVEEVKEYFPDADVSDIEERVYETNHVFDENITHNLGEMADHVPTSEEGVTLYYLLWRPEERGFDKVTDKYRNLVAECLAYMRTHRKELEQYNPDNGWGSYDGLLKFTTKLSTSLSEWDGKEEITIYASR